MSVEPAREGALRLRRARERRRPLVEDDLDLVGDAPCASAALKKAEMSLSSATYDSERDEIKIKMTYMTFLSRSFILEKAER